MQSKPEEPISPEDAFLAALLQLGSLLRHRLTGDDVDFTQIPLLRLLNHLGPVRHSVVAERLNLDASTISRQVRHLEQRGLIASRIDASDGRARLIHLTEDGVATLERLLQRRRQLIARVLAPWPVEDSTRLGELLHRFNQDLDALGPLGLGDGDATR